MAECNLPKVEVAGSNPVACSKLDVAGSNPVVRSKLESQWYSDGTGRWHVPRLVEAAAALTPEELPVAAFRDLDEQVWERDMTPRAAVAHLRRVLDADLSYPIIVSADGWVMDGCHRLAKALLEGRETVLAVRFEKNPPPDEVTDAL